MVVVRRGAGDSGGGGAPSRATGGAGVGDFLRSLLWGAVGSWGRKVRGPIFFDRLGFRRWERDGKRMGCTVASNVAS
jgi:hypothetical protein